MQPPHRVMATPTVISVRDGVIVQSRVGALSGNELTSMVAEL